MFAKLKESKFFKSLSGVLCFARKTPNKEGVAANPKEAKTGIPKKPDKATHPAP